MGLFGIKKVDEPKQNGTFINQDVINAADYSNMPNNVVVGYSTPTDEVQNNNNMSFDMNSYNQNNDQQTFVYTQVDSNDFNNQFVNMSVQQNNVQYSQDYNQNMSGYNTYPMDNNINQVATDYNQGQMGYDQVQTDYNQVQSDFSQFNNIPVEQVNVPVVDTINIQNTYTDQSVVMEVPVVETTPVVSAPVAETPVSEFSEATPTFDNSALFELPPGAVVEPEVEEEVQEEVLEEVVEEKEPEPVYDPLDNANNPIPVNPVAEKSEEESEEIFFEEEVDVKTNLFTVLNMIIGIIIKPATTMKDNAKKYKKMFNSLTITFWVGILSIVLCLAGRIVAGCFSHTQDAISGASKISLDFSGLTSIDNYVPYLLVTLVLGIIAIFIVSLVYYCSSFINSKGVHMGTYFAIGTLSMVPVIVVFTIVHPIVSILSSGIALLLLIFSIIYTLIILFTGMNEVLKFKTGDGRLIYNAINIAIIFTIMVFIFSTLSKLNIVDVTFIL